jgi:uncharacterized membrane protein YtjA (UPF0391 family)
LQPQSVGRPTRLTDTHRLIGFQESSHFGMFLALCFLEIGLIAEGGMTMLQWALIFFVIAIIAGFLGFGGIAGTAAGIAKFIFVVFAILLVISIIAHMMRGRGP